MGATKFRINILTLDCVTDCYQDDDDDDVQRVRTWNEKKENDE